MEFKAMKFNIGDNPEISKQVQEILFRLGYERRGLLCYGTHYLYAEEDGIILYGEDVTTFNGAENEEIDISWMKPQEPEYIELNGKKYLKSELEEALKHIKPVE